MLLVHITLHNAALHMCSNLSPEVGSKACGWDKNNAMLAFISWSSPIDFILYLSRCATAALQHKLRSCMQTSVGWQLVILLQGIAVKY